MLSWMLLEGEVVVHDYAESRKWALGAAEQNVASSMTRLGMIYHNALGVERDPALAAYWWRRGAERGDADGQAMLGAAYYLGAAVERDPCRALAWLSRAEAGGSKFAARFLAATRSILTEIEIAKAEQEARVPLPEPSP
jgi:TPR repeat protein